MTTEDFKSSINGSNTKDTQEVLYDHLKCYGDLRTLREFYEMAIDAQGFLNMQALGEDDDERVTNRGGYCLPRVSGPKAVSQTDTTHPVAI